MVLLKIFEDLRGRLVRIDFPGNLPERVLVLPQIRVPDLEQLVDRSVHHFFELQFLAIVLRSDTEIAIGAGQQVRLEKALVGGQRIDDGLIRLSELGSQGLIMNFVERQGNIALEEADDAWE